MDDQIVTRRVESQCASFATLVLDYRSVYSNSIPINFYFRISASIPRFSCYRFIIEFHAQN